MVNQHNFAVCRYCGESDPFELTVCTRFVNGKAESVDLCFRCYWREKFVHEAKEDGSALSESVEEGIFTQSDFHKLLERFNSTGEG